MSKAESLDEVGKAYERFETELISFSSPHGLNGGPRGGFVYHRAKSVAFIQVQASDHETAEQIIAAVSKEFPLVTKEEDSSLPSGLRLILRERFNESELRDFCFDLGVDYG